MKKMKTAFTLVETLIAVFILSMGIMGILAMFPIGVQVEKSAQILTAANQLAQAKIEENISKSYNEVITGTTTEEYGSISEFPYFKIITRINYYDPLTSTITNGDLGIKKIEVSIFWKSPLGSSEKNTKLESLISRR